MKLAPLGISILLAFAFVRAGAGAQTTPAQGTPPQSRSAVEAEADKLFQTGNALMDERKYADAYAKYKEALALLPDYPSVIYNVATAAALVKDFKTVAELSEKLLRLEPEDWQSRAKLIQAYQALGDLKARDEARAVLFEMRKSGRGENSAEPKFSLSRHEMYCRERLNVAGKEVMVFEYFELKGERALRYIFLVLDKEGRDEDFRITLGSYDATNAVWRETAKAKVGKDARLFHLDGYFPWGHATYGMYHPEPSYDEIRKVFVSILEGKTDPVSMSTLPNPQREVQKKKP